MQAQEVSQDSAFPQEIVQIGRQPILDRQQQTYGYELLYRDGGAGPQGMDANRASARTILNTFMEFGLKQLVGPHRAFINLTRTFFTDMQAPPVDKSRLVLEVLEDIEIDEDVIRGVCMLHKSGYTIALDDYRFESHWEPLLAHASIIKVDVMDLDLESYADEIRALKQRGITLLAEKVETRAEFQQCLMLGFDLFQGYFFSRPELVSNRRLPSNQKLLLQMLATINNPDCTIEELATLISRDPKLSFKILRFINSAAIGLSHKVESIQQAVVFVGLARIRAWASLFVMAGMDSPAPEVITTSLVRAELCQTLSRRLQLGDPVSAYTVGLLSVLDAMLNQPMAVLVEDLPLPAAMSTGLVEHTGTYGKELNCALALENYQWQDEAVSGLLPVAELTTLYVDALQQAEEIRRVLG